MASTYKKAAWSFKHKVNFSLLKSESLHTKSRNDRIQRNEMGIIATEVKEASSAKCSSYIAGHFLMPTPPHPEKSAPPLCHPPSHINSLLQTPGLACRKRLHVLQTVQMMLVPAHTKRCRSRPANNLQSGETWELQKTQDALYSEKKVVPVCDFHLFGIIASGVLLRVDLRTARGHTTIQIGSIVA